MGPKKKTDQPYIELNLNNNDINILKAKVEGSSKADTKNIKKVKKKTSKPNEIKVLSWGNKNERLTESTIMKNSLSSTDSNGVKDKNTKDCKKKEKNIACTRCRTKHMNCKKTEGIEQCVNCIDASAVCEYIAPKKKLNVSLTYLQSLQNEISQLKKETTKLKNIIKHNKNKKPNNFANKSPNNSDDEDLFNDNLIETENEESSNFAKTTTFVNYKIQNSGLTKVVENEEATVEDKIPTNEPDFSNENFGGIVGSKTGQKYFVGSSSMTHFCMEIHSLIERTKAMIEDNLRKNSIKRSGNSKPNSSNSKAALIDEVIIPNNISSDKSQIGWTNNNVDKILEEEGNAYKIILSSNESTHPNSFNFSLPPHSYAVLLIDTFITYNDGCFYFFNEGLEKANLEKIYNGEVVHEDQILQTIWFCKIMLIFAIGEMYLGTSSESKEIHPDLEKVNKSLPGKQFFIKSSAIFGYLYSGNKIDNFTKPGSVETLLLYAFYLQVADYTVSSYLYFSMTLKTCLILGWHCDAEAGKISKFELEHHRRLFWTIYIYERMLSSKAGHPLSFQDVSISCQLPSDFDMSNPPEGCENYIFPEAEYLLACINTTFISAKILNKLYNRKLKKDISPTVTSLLRELIEFRHSLPEFLQVDFDMEPFKITRLKCNIYTEYFNGINLAVRRLVYHFSHLFLKNWLNSGRQKPEFIRLDDYSENTIFLLNSSLNSSINTIQSLWSMYEQGQLAIFGYMDREYIFTAASTLVLLSSTFGLHEQVNEFLEKGLIVLTKMRDQGNDPASLRRKQLLRLVKDLNLRDQMSYLIDRFEKEKFGWENISPSRYNTSSTKTDEYIVTSDVVRTKSEPIQANSNDLQKSRSFESDRASPFPLHFLFNTPVGENKNGIIASPIVARNNHAEEVINDNKNKLLTTGREFDDIDKIFEILDNNLDDQLWRDMQEQPTWLM